MLIVIVFIIIVVVVFVSTTIINVKYLESSYSKGREYPETDEEA
jgi:hypothetical protein